MATYESFIKLNGSIGDLVFYNLNGKNIVRKKSGFNKAAYKKSPTYEKVRQNSSEFGHCSKIGKLIRFCISKYIELADDALLYQRFAKTMTKIKDLDVENEKGKRSVKNGLKTKDGRVILQQCECGGISNFNQNTQIFLGLWDKSLHLDKTIFADEVAIVSIKIDFENYLTESFEEKIKLQESQNEVIFENHFSEEDDVIHFVAVKKDSHVVQMGFV
ncbi:hypothetical protein [Chryseobacterium indoltheticum]|uniref:hypothetical protein n=1 Tax=Chryseobacterium indoltheticum TaxID=254 RepID=UPI0028E63320|nr:hypothetical protein [Chryseobacterium indoltheticum]